VVSTRVSKFATPGGGAAVRTPQKIAEYNAMIRAKEFQKERRVTGGWWLAIAGLLKIICRILGKISIVILLDDKTFIRKKNCLRCLLLFRGHKSDAGEA
jgi:hypothetical protein